MWNWIKSVLSWKNIARMAVDALDKAAPLLAKEIDKIKDKFNKMSSADQAQFVIDWVQAHLRSLFKLEDPPSA